MVAAEKNTLVKRNYEDFSNLIDNKAVLASLQFVNENSIKVMESIRKWEKVTETKNSRLRVNRSFSFCLGLMENTNQQNSQGKVNDKVVIGSPNNVITRLLNSDKKTLESIKPIILIPEELVSGNLNCENAGTFLSEGKYNVIEEGTKINHRPMEVKLDILGSRVAFDVYDDLNYLRNKKKLHLVAAIFIKGNPYQFKDVDEIWGENNIAKLFKRVRGYYLTFSDVALHPTVKNWNVKVLRVDRMARHKDLTIFQEFLDDFRRFLLSTD